MTENLENFKDKEVDKKIEQEPSYHSIMYCNIDTFKLREKGETKSIKAYNNFGPHPSFTIMSSGQDKAIFKVKVSQADDSDKECYWGWWDNSENNYSFIHKLKEGIQILFAYPIDEIEKTGQGKLMKVKVEVLEKMDNN